jgi:protein-glutamine gamma-glutamyltransferase
MNAAVIPRRPLLWLAAALIFLVPTMLGHLAVWVPAFFLCALLAKFRMEQRDRRLRSTILKLTLAAFGFGAVVLTYGRPTGLEAGISLLVVLAGLKILESHTARDFHVLVMIGWVLCLCGFLLAQDLAIALCVLAAFVLLAASLVQFHRRRAPGGPLFPPLKTAGKLLLQAAPIVVLLFILFPRGTAGLKFHLPSATADTTGFSGEVSPGSVASVATSEALVLRAEFPDGPPPPRERLYWRGAVLSQGNGLHWSRRSAGVEPALPIDPPPPGAIRQLITLEPQPGRWVFALDRPITAPPGAAFAPGRYLLSARRYSGLRRYEVISAQQTGEVQLQPDELRAHLRVPEFVSLEIAQLVESWRGLTSDPRQIVQQALEFFRTSGFVYSISPGAYTGPDPMTELLFQRRTGFCEHYAASFATLMRLAGVPARVVVGYLGGEWNQLGNYWLVRQSDAHAWCEVWLPGTGWTRVDPTSVVAPERLNLGSLRQLGTTSVQPQITGVPTAPPQPGAVQRAFDNVRLAWDTVSYTWDARVLSYDTEGQQELFSEMGWGDTPGLRHLLWIAGAAALLLGAYLFWSSWRSRPPADVVKALYDRFCRRAAKLGATRAPAEGPRDFAARAAALLPQQAPRIARILDTYVQLRYSPQPDAAALRTLRDEVAAFRRGK